MPDFLDEVPRDPFTCEEMRYRLIEDDPWGRAYLVYSTGSDRVDDGGREDEEWRRAANLGESGFDLVINRRPRGR